MKIPVIVPSGNDFSIVICHSNIAPANPSELSFADITDLTVSLTRMNGKEQIEYALTESGDLLLTLPSNLTCTTYGVEAVGTYNGDSWRWKGYPIFRVVDNSNRSNKIPEETFMPERYYIGDTLDIDIDSDDLDVISHDLADIDDEGTLTITTTDDLNIRINKEIMEVKHGNQENSFERPAWPCPCVG